MAWILTKNKTNGSGESQIDTIKVNDVILIPDSDKAVNIEVPTNTNDLVNNSGFITNTVDNLLNYYLKTETYSKNEVNNLIDAVSSVTFEVVQALPSQDISVSTIYLVPKQDAETNDIYDEYIYVNDVWEKIGSTEMDLTNYVTTSDLNNALAAYTTSQNLNNLLNAKQDVLTPGNNIDITNGVISATDTTYTSKSAVSGGTDVSLVTTGEKYNWNSKVDSSNLADVALSGSYNDLTNKPTIPTKTSQLTNDSGFSTFSGNYNDLTNKPTHLGHTVINENNTILTDRPRLHFTGNVSVKDNATNGETDVEILGTESLKPLGNTLFANLPTTPSRGDMYKVTDDFTTDNRFEEPNKEVKAPIFIYFNGTKWVLFESSGGDTHIIGTRNQCISWARQGMIPDGSVCIFTDDYATSTPYVVGTQAQINAMLSQGLLGDGTVCVITDDYTEELNLAQNIGYSNTTSGLSATNVQSAIDEVENALVTYNTCKADSINLLNVSNTMPLSIATGDASTLVNSPITSGPFIGVREAFVVTPVYYIVRITEIYPTPGRVWTNVYNSNIEWQGWKSITPN